MPERKRMSEPTAIFSFLLIIALKTVHLRRTEREGRV